MTNIKYDHAILWNSMQYHPAYPSSYSYFQLYCFQVFLLLAGCMIAGSQSARRHNARRWIAWCQLAWYCGVRWHKGDKMKSCVVFCILYFVFLLLYSKVNSVDDGMICAGVVEGGAVRFWTWVLILLMISLVLRLSIDNRHKRECLAVDCAAKCHP